jgi:hypothetical protein
MTSRRPAAGKGRILLAILLAYGLALKAIAGVPMLPSGSVEGVVSAEHVLCLTDVANGDQPAGLPSSGKHDCDTCCHPRVPGFAAPEMAVAIPVQLPEPVPNRGAVPNRRLLAEPGPPSEAWAEARAQRAPPSIDLA